MIFLKKKPKKHSDAALSTAARFSYSKVFLGAWDPLADF